ncbi:MAG: transposase [Pedobacter sp.]|nr:MAG: transposase [Pedobacter sp.]
MNKELIRERRNSFLEYKETYFWTCTIKDWKHLLEEDIYKKLIINSLKTLVEKDLIEIYGFVIMPNHIHLILKLLKPNGKEKPSASFLKETAHLLKKDLLLNNPNVLRDFLVSEIDRNYRVWQRDALAVELFNESVLEQKLTYIHNKNKKALTIMLRLYWLVRTPTTECIIN